MIDVLKENSDAITEILQENSIEETQEEVVEDDNIEIKGETEENKKSLKEPEIDPKEELEFLRLTSGWTKEEKELVKKIKDPELKTEAIEATKKRRIDYDRRSLELGNTKKELAEMRIKIEELTSNQNKPVASEDDEYLTEQELRQQKKLEDVEKQLKEMKRVKSVEDSQTAQEEIISFAQSTNEDGILKYPHFQRVRQDMYLLFQTDRSGVMTLETAYNKAILLDEELSEEILLERDLRTKLKQKEALLKVKKNKKYSPTVNNSNRKLSPKEMNAKAIAEIFS